jgi:hypothetical protein
MGPAGVAVLWAISSAFGSYSMKMKCIGIAGWLFASMLGLQAQVFELSPFYGYRFGGSIENSSGGDTDLEAGRSYGLSLDFAPRESDMRLELFWSRQDSGLDLDGSDGFNHVDMLVDEFQFGGVYEHGWGRLHETVTALVGATVFSPDGGDREARFSFGVGLGVKYFLLKNLALRADLRGYCTVVEAESAFISIGGTTVAFFSGSAVWQGEVSGGITLSF